MKNSLENKLKKLNVAIVTHIFATGPALDLEEYLKYKTNNLIFIGHPFSFSKTPNSFLRIYSRYKLIRNSQSIYIKKPDILLYLKDAFLTFWWVLTYQKKINLYIGSDGFVAFLGLLLKRLGKVDDVVLYTIDFMPKRFANPILNWAYHYFDEQCLRHCKVVWNLSDKMAEGREEYMGISREKFVPQLTVPLGIWDKRIEKLPFQKKERFQMVFMGHIIEKQGLDIVIEALPEIIKEISNVKLLIVGTGQYEDTIKRKIKRLNLSKHVLLTGYVERHEDVERMLSESMIAVATYKPDPDSFTYFADPGKIKNYLSAGLPVILTDVPPIANEIETKKCAVIVEYSKEDFAKAAIRLLSSPSLLKQYSKNAINFAGKFDWEKVFKKALNLTLS